MARTAADYTGKGCRLALRFLGRQPPVVQRWREMATRFGAGSHGPPHDLDGISSGTFAPTLSTPAPRRRGRCVDDGVREGDRVMSIPRSAPVNARACTGSSVPIGAEPFRQGREHGHGRFWPLIQYGV